MIPILRTFTLIPITQVQLIESTMLLCNMSDRARFHMNLTQDAVNQFFRFFLCTVVTPNKDNPNKGIFPCSIQNLENDK